MLPHRSPRRYTRDAYMRRWPLLCCRISPQQTHGKQNGRHHLEVNWPLGMANSHTHQSNVDTTAACLVAQAPLLPSPCRASRCAASDLAAHKAALIFIAANALTCPTQSNGGAGPGWSPAATSGSAGCRRWALARAARAYTTMPVRAKGRTAESAQKVSRGSDTAERYNVLGRGLDRWCTPTCPWRTIHAACDGRTRACKIPTCQQRVQTRSNWAAGPATRRPAGLFPTSVRGHVVSRSFPSGAATRASAALSTPSVCGIWSRRAFRMPI